PVYRVALLRRICGFRPEVTCGPTWPLRPVVLKSEAGGICVSIVSIVCLADVRCPQGRLDALRPITAGSTDDADGTDAIFSTRTHSDHSGARPASTRERDLDA